MADGSRLKVINILLSICMQKIQFNKVQIKINCHLCSLRSTYLLVSLVRIYLWTSIFKSSVVFMLKYGINLITSIVEYFVTFSNDENDMLLKNFHSYFHPWVKMIRRNKAHLIKQTCGCVLCNTLICDYSIEKKMNPDNSLLFRLCYPLKNYFNFFNSLLTPFLFLT